MNNVSLGGNNHIMPFVNIYKCKLGKNTSVGPFVEIQDGVIIGNNCKISSHSFLCTGVQLGNNVFVGHTVTFTNDRFPRATTKDGQPQTSNDWLCEKTIIEDGVSIGSGSTILCGITIGKGAMIGCGSVVTKDVAPNVIVVGNPATFLRNIDNQ